jgi:hypothetical protein
MMRSWRQTNPVKAAFSTIKESARKRRIPFALTMAGFTEFCTKSGYLDLKGRFADCLQVDRKDHRLGYTDDNIQPLVASENCRKGQWEKKNKHTHPELVEAPF